MVIKFLGDISLNGKYIDMYKESKNPFSVFEKNVSEADYTIGNLESFVSGDNGENHLKKPRLTTTPETLNYLKNINLDIACLANNHVYDHLESGFYKTVQLLEQYEIQYLGASCDEKKASIPVIIQKGDVTVGVLNYVTHDTNPKIPIEASITPNFFLTKKVIKDIETLKEKVDHVVLSLHWGGKVEGGLFPDYNQPLTARKLVDAGADLIVGHHSHTFQPYEIYKGKYIFYSLGNFCFSDYWFEDKYYNLPKRRRVAGIVNVNFDKNNYHVDLKFYKNKIEYFTELKNYPIGLLNVIKTFILSNKVCWYFYYFNLKTLLPLILFLKRKDLTIEEKTKRILRGFLKKIINIA